MRAIKITTFDVTVNMTRSREFQKAGLELHEGGTLDEGEDVQACIDTVRADLAQQVDDYTQKLVHKMVEEARKPMP